MDKYLTMTKKDAIKFLSNTKVYVDGKSKEIQEKLFELGFKWEYNYNKVVEIDRPFLFMDEDMDISHSSSMNHFKGAENKEIKAEEILAITIDEECEFKPFDRVLVRDSDGEIWHAGIFSHLNKGLVFPFSTTNSRYKCCIPYEGNEHLVGTNNSPNGRWK